MVIQMGTALPRTDFPAVSHPHSILATMARWPRRDDAACVP
jgi:hypothetical protein